MERRRFAALEHPLRRERRRRRLLLALFLTLAFGLGVGGYLLNRRNPGVIPTNPVVAEQQACQLHDGKGAYAPEMVEVPDGEYDLSRLAPASRARIPLTATDLSRILVKKPFLIQLRAVSREAFARYVAHVRGLPEGEEKGRLLIRIGMHWQQSSDTAAANTIFPGSLFGNRQETPLQSISWEAAQGYAEWMSDRSGCSYHLPSREEWAAAVMYLHGGVPSGRPGVPAALAGRHDIPLATREWTRSACTGGYYLAGGEGSRSGVGSDAGYCMPAMVSIAGFRLVLRRNHGPDQIAPPAAGTAP
ncbi:MAG: SUMF1/EgtB/PvdO family nonheme iron enzyme [Magnetococcales bacterium]|nr:SUMF1/EgtB/PvdO family nonheme iron enzyme [Magnetococcales bacterium]